jgi:gliding motility-associated lipoprotein GldH
MNKLKWVLFLITLTLSIVSCSNNNLVDTNDAVAENNWLYAKSAKATVEIKDINQPYAIHFKLRHTVDYKYANLFVVMRLKGDSLNKSARYEVKLAKNNGEWIGKGSGNIFTNNFALVKDYRFKNPGKYQIEITQNMKDNPLVGISDVGITVSKQIENLK